MDLTKIDLTSSHQVAEARKRIESAVMVADDAGQAAEMLGLDLPTLAIVSQLVRANRHQQPRRAYRERFWAHVAIRGQHDCWEWSGRKTKADGYGRFHDGQRYRPAHVISWELTHDQDFPPGLLGCHHCDNPGCVNPYHVFPGSHRDNALDMHRKRNAGQASK